MDSDDEEEKIQKLREARQKRLNQLKTAETEQSPSSSPQAQSPLGQGLKISLGLSLQKNFYSGLSLQ